MWCTWSLQSHSGEKQGGQRGSRTPFWPVSPEKNSLAYKVVTDPESSLKAVLYCRWQTSEMREVNVQGLYKTTCYVFHKCIPKGFSDLFLCNVRRLKGGRQTTWHIQWLAFATSDQARHSLILAGLQVMQTFTFMHHMAMSLLVLDLCTELAHINLSMSAFFCFMVCCSIMNPILTV